MKKRENPWYVATMLLGVRPRSVAELFGRLADKGFPLDEVQRTVDKCRELGYLNDREFAAGVCDQVLACKTVGKKKLYVKLRWFGLKEDLISEIMAEKLPPEKELEMAQYAGNKKKQQLIKRGIAKEKWYQKISQYLLGRGFGGEVVGRTVGKICDKNYEDPKFSISNF